MDKLVITLRGVQRIEHRSTAMWTRRSAIAVAEKIGAD